MTERTDRQRSSGGGATGDEEYVRERELQQGVAGWNDASGAVAGSTTHADS